MPELSPLEERMLLYFSVEATVAPSTLWPPNDRYVPVTVTGTAREFTVEGRKQVFKKLPGAKKANFIVTDEYRQDEPYGPIKLIDAGGGKYNFSVTFHLQAQRSEEFVAGRRFYINVAVKDDDGWGSKELVVQVPRTLQDRGPGPLQPGPAKTNHKAQLQGHPNGVHRPARHR